MADIFLSYASEDRDRIRPLVAALEHEGWSVWWDREIVPGTSFDAMIEEAISEASCVVVAWTEHSVKSEWVRREALWTLDNRDNLVPVLLDDVEIPLAFHRTQAARLLNWPKSGSKTEFARLLNGIAQKIGGESTRAITQPNDTAPDRLSDLPTGDTLQKGASDDVAKRRDLRRRGIAVLPFLNMSDDRNNEFFADGMTEDLIIKLGARLDMMVIARASSFHYKGKSPDIRDVGRELGIFYVLEGSVRPMGETTRITAQLIDTEQGSQIWSDVYDRKTNEMFTVQDDLVDAIAQALNSSVNKVEFQNALRKPVEDLEVWELLARASESTQGKLEGLRDAEALIDQALLKDPDHPKALAWKGLYMAGRYIAFEDNVPPEELKEETLVQLRMAREVVYGDPLLSAQIGQAYAELGEYEEALAIMDVDDPGMLQFTEYYMALGYTLTSVGQAERGVELMEEGLRRDPVGFTYFWWQWLAFGYAANRNFEKAIAAVRESLRLQPRYLWAWISLAIWLVRDGDLPGAAKAIEGARKANPNLTPEVLGDMYDNLKVDDRSKSGLMRYFEMAWQEAGL